MTQAYNEHVVRGRIFDKIVRRLHASVNAVVAYLPRDEADPFFSVFVSFQKILSAKSPAEGISVFRVHC